MIKKSVIDKALKIAKTSQVERGKVGAVLFTDSGHILAAAPNAVVLGYIKDNRFTIHAEEFLLAKSFRLKAVARFGRKNLNIIVVRYKPLVKGLANACPCEKCNKLLDLAGIKVYYSDDEGEIQELN